MCQSGFKMTSLNGRGRRQHDEKVILVDDVDLFTVLPTGRPASIPTRQTGLAARIDRDREGLGT
jgi:hypothetical protein